MDDFTKKNIGNCMTKNNTAAIYKIDDEIMSCIGSNMLSGVRCCLKLFYSVSLGLAW
jgi:hypothetical protein